MSIKLWGGPHDSILEGKWILAVEDEPDILDVLAEEILAKCPKCRFDTANTFEELSAMLALSAYDLVILDIMGGSGFDFFRRAVSMGTPAVILTPRSLNPESMKESFELGARGYIRKDAPSSAVYLDTASVFDWWL